MDLGPALGRELIYPRPGDPLGTGGVYSQPGRPQPKVQTDAVALLPVDGVELGGWWADRCTVDLYDVSSSSGATLRLQLVCANVKIVSTPKVVLSRGVVIPAGTKSETMNLQFGVASGWLAQFWVLLARVTVAGNDATFSARYTLDRAGAGLYADPGDGTIP